jgi:PIN domain nuclease of toxin-antitoxin system
MRVLPDSPVFIWSMAVPERLSSSARDVISNADPEVFVSLVSIWEWSIKAGLGRLDGDLWRAVRTSRFERCPLALAHVRCAGTPPMHHKDPFDRMRVAQALVERLDFISRDALITRCGIPTIR